MIAMTHRWQRLPVLLLIVAGLAGCATTGAKPTLGPGTVVGTRIDRLADVSGFVAQAQPPVLVVLDIDDTLLTTPDEGGANRKFFGSDRWFTWQRGLRAATNDRDRVPCMADVNGMIYEVGSQVPVENGAGISAINALTADRIALTSRHPRYRGPTEREWFRATYNELPMLANAMGEVNPARVVALDTAAPMTYQRGIFMTGGGNKGKMLEALLKQLDRASYYRTVILVDDSGKNIADMESALKPTAIAFVGLHYLGVKGLLAEPPLPKELKEGRRDWKSFRASLESSFPERWARLKTGSGCALNDPT